MNVGNPSDREIGAAFKSYLRWYTRGTLDDLYFLYEEIAESDRSGFPWQVAVDVLSQVPPRRLFRAFDDEELQDLYDWANDAELHDAAARYAQASIARPYVDDGRVPPEVKTLVFERDDGRCQSCGATDELTLDHKIIPWVDGGSSKDPENLQVLCRSCNSRKGTKPWPIVSSNLPEQ